MAFLVRAGKTDFVQLGGRPMVRSGKKRKKRLRKSPNETLTKSSLCFLMSKKALSEFEKTRKKIDVSQAKCQSSFSWWSTRAFALRRSSQRVKIFIRDISNFVIINDFLNVEIETDLFFARSSLAKLQCPKTQIEIWTSSWEFPIALPAYQPLHTKPGKHTRIHSNAWYALFDIL